MTKLYFLRFRFDFRMMWIIAIINFLYAPLCTFLRNPRPKEEKQVPLPFTQPSHPLLVTQH